MNQTIGEIVENAAVVSHASTIDDAIEALASQDVDRIYIEDSGGKVSRVICDFTLLKSQVRGDLESATLSCLASPLPESLDPSQPLEKAAVLFRSGAKSEIPVVDGEKFLGVVRRKRLIKQLLLQKISLDTAKKTHTIDSTSSEYHSKASILTGLSNQQARKIG